MATPSEKRVLVNPIVAVFLGVLLLHERLTARTAVGMVIILISVGVILRPRRRLLK